MKTLNIIGAGRAGRALAALWQRHRVFAIGNVLNRTLSSARDAVAFMGAGEPATDWRDIHPAELWMISTPDGEIAHAAANLAASGLARVGDVVFHCSGALDSGILRESLPVGVAMASVHPLKSFADAQTAVHTFAGTWCAGEGDEGALAQLTPAFEQIGARVMRIELQYKTLYHAASVIVCNYLTALMAAGLACYEKAGLARETASAMMEPLVRETVDNVFKLGPVKALTGPVARGDHTVVARQLAALHAFDPRIADIYRSLGVIALELAHAQSSANADTLAALQKTFDIK